MKQSLLRHTGGLIEELNFLLTNRIPRVGATRLLGWFSHVENPWVVRASIAVWRRLGGLDLSDAVSQNFPTLHACFTRALLPGSRAVDPSAEALVSPCDGYVMACGPLAGLEAIQAKGLRYTLHDLLGSAERAERLRDGVYVTLRLSSGMYHRFHAPTHGTLRQVTHIAGDTWNVNPAAVRRVPLLYCRNERAVLEMLTPVGLPLLLVPVAAVGVAGLRLHAVRERLGLSYRGPREIPCFAQYDKGAELGWFEQGSTVIVIAPAGVRIDAAINTGMRLRMGQRLMLLPEQP